MSAISSNPEPICRIVTPIGMLGYGFDEEEIRTILDGFANKSVPTALILDSGSTDSGPRKLARGDMTVPRSSYARDIRKLLRISRSYRIPLLISSAGGSGTNAQVDEIFNICDEIAHQDQHALKVVRIYSDISKSLVTKRLQAGKINGCGDSVPALTQEDIDDCSVIASQMGVEPFLEAIRQTPDYDVIIGGRAYDPIPYVAFATEQLRKCQRSSVDNFITSNLSGDEAVLSGGILHMGKIMECGGLCASPKSPGAVATIYADGSFDIAPTSPLAKCTPVSVAAHALYEKSRPDILHGPGGWLDLSKSSYEQLSDGRTTRVKGSTFHESVRNGIPYQIKLEAARNKGFRSMYMGGIKDPILIAQLDAFLPRIKLWVAKRMEHLHGWWELDWHIYGRQSNEIFLIGEVRAETQELATSVAAASRTATIHGSYPGQKATAGNFAHGIGATTEIQLGECAEFCIYHLMDLMPGEEGLQPVSDDRSLHVDGEALFTFKSSRLDYSVTAANDTSNISSALGSHTSSSPSKDAKHNAKDQAAQDSSTSPCVVPLSQCRTLADVASVLRSKNSGPYEITFDVMFADPAVYAAIKSSGILTAETIAHLFRLPGGTSQVVWAGFFDQALAFKATVPRMKKGIPSAGGGFMEEDIHGSQMHVPLFALLLPDNLKQQLTELDVKPSTVVRENGSQSSP